MRNAHIFLPLELLDSTNQVTLFGSSTTYAGNFFFLDSQRLRPTIHEIITAKIKAHAEHVNSSRPAIGQSARTATKGYQKGQLESYQLPKQKRQNGFLLSGTLSAVSPVSPVMAPMGTAQAAAKELLDSIMDTIVRIFGQIYNNTKLKTFCSSLC